jgi:hypothetical protein
MTRTLSSIAAALTLAITASSANATCVQANAAGTWAAYSAGTTTGAYYWFKCALTINAAGKITAGSCTESNGLASPITGSVRLTVPASCTFTGALDFTKFKQTATVNQATMSLDKQAVLGIGSVATNKFTFNMLKTK